LGIRQTDYHDEGDHDCGEGDQSDHVVLLCRPLGSRKCDGQMDFLEEGNGAGAGFGGFVCDETCLDGT
jgi:hypothetical protein